MPLDLTVEEWVEQCRLGQSCCAYLCTSKGKTIRCGMCGEYYCEQHAPNHEHGTFKLVRINPTTGKIIYTRNRRKKNAT